MLNDAAVKPLILAINKSLETSLQGIVESVPEALLKKLKSDVFVFSGCKTIAELREASSLLIDDAGKVRPWNSFKDEMNKLHKLYNETYLESEYNFANESANMASRWTADSKDGDQYFLQYRTAGDDKVRQSHEALNNITLPVSDEFWSKYYPPNGWRCRCTAVQVSPDKYPLSDTEQATSLGERATTQINKDGKNSLEMFRFNPGKDEVVFPPSHPYFKLKGDLNGE